MTSSSSARTIDSEKQKTMNSQLILLMALILASGLFSAAEIALTALNRAKIRAMKEDERFGSKMILKLKEDPQRTLISILISNQIANVLATVVVTLWGVSLFGEGRIGLVTFIFTIILILTGSIGPKTLALRFSEPIARVLSYPLYFFILLISPLWWFIKGIARGFRAMFNIQSKNSVPSSSNEEIRAMLEIAEEEGVLGEEEENFMVQILKFRKTEVKDIMTLLKDIQAISFDATQQEMNDFLKEHNHTHFPVYEDSLNKIRGIVTLKEVVQLIHQSKAKRPLHHHRFNTAVVVPKTASIVELFKVFKEKKKRIAIVFDEYGQTIGLVTLNDILEEITGLKTQEKPEAKLTKIKANQWEAEGEVIVSKLNEVMEMTLPFYEHQTVAFVILENLKRFPETDEVIDFEEFSMTIQRIEKNVIKKVLIKKKPGQKKI